jgi:hypothetical protein
MSHQALIDFSFPLSLSTKNKFGRSSIGFTCRLHSLHHCEVERQMEAVESKKDRHHYQFHRRSHLSSYLCTTTALGSPHQNEPPSPQRTQSRGFLLPRKRGAWRFKWAWISLTDFVSFFWARLSCCAFTSAVCWDLHIPKINLRIFWRGEGGFSPCYPLLAALGGGEFGWPAAARLSSTDAFKSFLIFKGWCSLSYLKVRAVTLSIMYMM